MNIILGYFLAILVGISLGLVGSGGSILSVPILVYILKVEPVLATAYSLFIVGTTALVGGIQKAIQKLVDFKKVILFGVPTVIAVFITRMLIIPIIPNIIKLSATFSVSKSVLIMVIFANVMLFASIKMIRPMKPVIINDNLKLNYPKIIFQGLLIGFVAGFVGAGGGFLIIPALLFLTKTPMKIAVGTSLFIVASQSLLGFIGDLSANQNIDWKLLITFSGLSIIGVFIGTLLSKKIPSENLKTGFGYFVLLMGLYILSKELFFN
ncbi:MAG: sulfite exporter TauE/SafE family protein [Flavobacterium sp.]|nr:sulfite exporter TauE/SafE family protein [Flavobacterium sp.]